MLPDRSSPQWHPLSRSQFTKSSNFLVLPNDLRIRTFGTTTNTRFPPRVFESNERRPIRMLPIVTDVERVHHHSTPRSPRSARVLRRVGIPALTVVSVLTSTVFVVARPAAGDAISDAKAKAAAIEAQLTQAQDQMSALSQQYDAAQYHLSQINSSIATTKANVAANEAQVAKDKATLSKAAVANYISDGTASGAEPDLQRQRADARCHRHVQQGRRGRHLSRRRQPAHRRELAELHRRANCRTSSRRPRRRSRPSRTPWRRTQQAIRRRRARWPRNRVRSPTLVKAAAGGRGAAAAKAAQHASRPRQLPQPR